MASEHFSPLERSFLEEESWFQSIRVLERNPQLMSEDFGRRLALAAESSGDEAEMHLLRESSQLVARAVAVGVEEALREKVGEGGVFAGRAREAWSRYYETRNPRDLAEAVDLFFQALACDEDPLSFDQGRTLQGFGAALLDLSDLLRDPLVNHVGCLAFLAASTAHLAVDMPLDEARWNDRLASLISGVRSHLDRIESYSPGSGESEFHRSVRSACELVEKGLGEVAGGLWERLEATMPMLSVAFACPKVTLPSPPSSSPPEAQIQQAAEIWLSIVLGWLERYGSDCFRAWLAFPPPDPFAADGAEGLSGRRFELPGLEDFFAGIEPEASGVEAPMTRARATLTLLMLAVMGVAAGPEEARTHLEMAERLLREADETAAGDLDSPFHSLSSLNGLAAGVRACLQDDAGEFERFRAIREAWPTPWLEEMVATVEEELDAVPEGGESAPSLVHEAAAQAATCLRDPIARLAATGNDLGLPDAARYRQILDRLNDLLFDERPHGGAFRIDEGTPGLSEKAELVARFELDPSSLDEAECEELCDWLGAAYEAGQVSFPNTDAELTLLVNLGWLGLRLRREDTLKWTGRARRLALDEGALMDAATADVNASSFYLEALRAGPPWSVDVDDAPPRLLALCGALSHALEALRIVTAGLELSDPEDRFHAGSLGYGEIRQLIEDGLFEAEDVSLLAEYLLNARGMWFLLDLYDTASGAGDCELQRPVISWRNRAWMAQSLLVDRDLAIDRLGSAAEVDVAEILSPGGEPQAFWFGNVLAGDRTTVASSLIAPPDAFLAGFEEYPAALREPGAMSCLEVAAALGRLLPERMWAVVDALRERGERSTLFVSLDPGLPPLSMGLWRRPGEGGATVLADAFDVVYCPALAPRRGLTAWVEESRAAAPQAFVVCDPLGDLPEARTVPGLAQRVCGNAREGTHPPADRETVLAMVDACALADGVFVYQGHSESGGIDDPGAACLLLEPVGSSAAVAEPLYLRELLRGVRDSAAERMPRRAAFLSCASGSSAAPYDATGLAMGALAAGSDAVVSTLRPVSDMGPWEEIVNQATEVLRAPRPWRAFAGWQRQAARELEAAGSEEARWAVSSLAMFGAPYIRGAATVTADG